MPRQGGKKRRLETVKLVIDFLVVPKLGRFSVQSLVANSSVDLPVNYDFLS